MKVAVTTSDGFHVDENFAKSNSFYIFDLIGKQINFLEARNTQKRKETIEATDHDNIDKIIHLLKDCKALFTTDMEYISFMTLKSKGIIPIIYQGDINDLFL